MRLQFINESSRLQVKQMENYIAVKSGIRL